MPSDLVERYINGDEERVWAELRRVQRPSDLDRSDVELVVREAMTRAATNVSEIIHRLRTQGYEFGSVHSVDGATLPHAAPDAHTPAFVTWLTGTFGPIPATARSWIEVVGDVSLVGRHPAWPSDAVVDPLVVEFEYKSWRMMLSNRLGPRAHYEADYEQWMREEREGEGSRPFTLDVAPDALHKANISGGEPYGVVVPDDAVDAMFRYRDGVWLPFIQYLRLAFSFGGFPGFWHQEHGERARRAVRELADGLRTL